MFKAIVLSGLCAIAAFAQTTTSLQVVKLADETSFGPIGITAFLAGPTASIPGAPYSAQAVTQRVQILADGNRITQSTTNNVARDSKGRVRREESLPAFGNGNTEPPRLVIIDDPVAGVHVTLDSTSKTATKLTLQGAKRAAESKALTTFTNVKSEGSSIVKTDLGTQTIDGVVAKGTKITHTIPAGEMGNDLPIVITTETWSSADLKVLVMSKSIDPRMGETTYELTNLSRSEPDPALFQIPADYAIKEPSGDVVFINKKTDK
jgi:hypothetical protein